MDRKDIMEVNLPEEVTKAISEIAKELGKTKEETLIGLLQIGLYGYRFDQANRAIRESEDYE